MSLGKIVEEGKTAAIFEHLLPPYSRALLSSVLYPDPNRQLLRFMLGGEIPSLIDLPPGCHLYQRCPWAEEKCNRAYPALAEHALQRRITCFRAAEEIDENPC